MRARRTRAFRWTGSNERTTKMSRNAFSTSPAFSYMALRLLYKVITSFVHDGKCFSTNAIAWP